MAFGCIFDDVVEWDMIDRDNSSYFIFYALFIEFSSSWFFIAEKLIFFCLGVESVEHLLDGEYKCQYMMGKYGHSNIIETLTLSWYSSAWSVSTRTWLLSCIWTNIFECRATQSSLFRCSGSLVFLIANRDRDTFVTIQFGSDQIRLLNLSTYGLILLCPEYIVAHICMHELHPHNVYCECVCVCARWNKLERKQNFEAHTCILYTVLHKYIHDTCCMLLEVKDDETSLYLRSAHRDTRTHAVVERNGLECRVQWWCCRPSSTTQPSAAF